MGGRPERRSHPRIPVNLAASIKRVDENEFEIPKTSTVRDLSREGIFIGANELFDIGSVIEVNLKYFDDDEEVFFLLSFIGIVRWRKENAPRGMGLQIIKAASSNKEQLNRLIEKQTEIISNLPPSSDHLLPDLPNEIEPFVVCRVMGEKAECAYWTLKDGRKAVAMFLSGDSATSFREFAGLGEEWQIFRPSKENLPKLLTQCHQNGISFVALDPSPEGIKKLYDIDEILE